MMQQSINGCEKVLDILKSLSRYEEADIVAVQDLDFRDNNYDRIFAPFRVITSSKIGHSALTGIAITNSDLHAFEVEELRTKYSCCVSINTQLGDLYALSVCLPASEEIDEALQTMDDIFDKLDGEMFVVAVNTNAKSPWWSCDDSKSDERGCMIEDFILKNTLCVLNSKDRTGEHWTPEGHTDVTLSSSNVVNTVMKWMAMGDVDGRRVARTDLMLQNFAYHGNPKRMAKKVPRHSRMQQKNAHTVFHSVDKALTSFEGSTSRWNETDIDKVGERMKKCTLTGPLNCAVKLNDSLASGSL